MNETLTKCINTGNNEKSKQVITRRIPQNWIFSPSWKTVYLHQIYYDGLY